MRHDRLERMVRGWLVGDFEPAVLRSSEVEVGIKRYKSGDYESRHVHKIATEITVVVSGKVEMNDISYVTDDIIVLEPGDETDFRAIEDSVTLVVKLPSVAGDKYLC